MPEAPTPCSPMDDFEREIRYRTGRTKDGALLLYGTLRDRYHDLSIEVTVEADSLAILDGSVRFAKAPSPYCTQAEERLKLLKGAVIGRGVGRRLAEAFAGSDGCGNLRTLLTGLLPLAMNMRAAEGIADEERMHAAIARHLQGTCAGYPEEA